MIVRILSIFQDGRYKRMGIIFICIIAGAATVLIYRFYRNLKNISSVYVIRDDVTALIYRFCRNIKASVSPILSGRKSDVIGARKTAMDFADGQNYNNYNMTLLQKVKFILLAATIITTASYVFFHNTCISVILSLFSLLYPGIVRKKLIKKQKNTLALQFKDALYCISSSLSSGRSVEGAFKAAAADLQILYGSGNEIIIKELELISRKLEMNETLENILQNFSGRSGVDDIASFTEVFAVCRQAGGNLIEVIKNTTSVISCKIEILNEIEILAAEQKLSQKILNIMPFGLLVLIMTSSPDYIKPLYSARGNAVMACVLGLLAASYFIGSKIMDIKV